MRIAIVAEPYLSVPPAKYGGTEQVIYYLIKGLQEAGHEPILLGTADSEVDCEIVPIVKKAVSFAATPAGLPRQYRQVATIRAATEQQLHKVIKRVDIIHSHGFDLKNFQHFPNLTTLHVRMDFDLLPYYQKRQHFPFVSISKNYQRSHPGLNYVRVVYNGEDPSEFPIVTEPDNYVCFVGRIDRDKSPHLAMHMAISMGLKIKIVGKLDYDGHYYFRHEIKPYLDHPLVEYLGELKHEDVIEIMSKAKCNLHPLSFREPFGLTVIEAAYCGTPTLAIKRGSMSELVEHGRTGIIVEDFMEGQWQLERCFRMNRTYIARRTRTRFNYRKMTTGYLKAYGKVLRDFKL